MAADSFWVVFFCNEATEPAVFPEPDAATQTL